MLLDTLTNLFVRWTITPSISEYLAVLVVLVLLLVVSFSVNFFLKYYLVRFARSIIKKTHSQLGATLNKQKVFRRLSHLGPGLIIYAGAALVSTPAFPHTDLVQWLKTLVSMYMLLAIVWFFMSLLDTLLQYYATLPIANRHPIHGYVQLIKIILWVITLILLISFVLNKSPLVFLTGLGAISAVLMLVFKDTILGVMASVQVSTYDMVRVGDWIVLPKLGANGDVMEVNINTVKIQNFDKTIVTVPTYALVSQGVQNWRGMQEAGGRRIKRSINIDMGSIQFCDASLLKVLHGIEILKEYLVAKEEEISKHNTKNTINKSLVMNGRALTNIGIFRAYIEAYLRQRSDIHLGLTCMIRYLDPTPMGLPVQLYVFTNDTDWVRYEKIQADIFDHLLAALPIFKLRVFQQISGHLESNSTPKTLENN